MAPLFISMLPTVVGFSCVIFWELETLPHNNALLWLLSRINMAEIQRLCPDTTIVSIGD